MPRPLRLEIAGGRYHVTASGLERKSIFRDETDRFRFLELLSEVRDRFGARVRAYVLMDNHFHLPVKTLNAKLVRILSALGGRSRLCIQSCSVVRIRHNPWVFA